jgi:hypothetical protein
MRTAISYEIKLLIPAGGFIFIINFHHNLIMRQDTVPGVRPTWLLSLITSFEEESCSRLKF